MVIEQDEDGKGKRWPWCSNKAKSFPAQIWFRFDTDITITKIGFSSRRDNGEQAPKKFDVVGVPGHGLTTPPRAKWQFLMRVENSWLTKPDQREAWLIPRQFWSMKFNWLGLNIHSPQSKRNQLPKNTCLHHMLMWGKRK